MLNQVQAGNYLDLIAPSGGVVSGQLVVIGSLTVVACTAAAEGLPFVGGRHGVFEVNKAADVAFAAGDIVFADAVAGNVDNDVTNPIGGICVEGVAGSGTKALVLLDPGAAAAGLHVDESYARMVANTSVEVQARAPWKGKLIGIATYTGAKPSSAAGAATMTSSKGGTNVLSGANVNLEGLTDDTLQTQALSATPADLAVTAGAIITHKLTSDHADLAPGEGITIYTFFARAG